MNNNQRQPAATSPNNLKVKHEPAPSMSLPHMALLVLGIANMFLIPLALFAMSEASGPVESFKLLIVGVGASAAAYAVNRFAVDHLAPLAAIGFRMAAVFAISSILVTGAGTALGSLTGIVYGSVEVKTYQTNGQELTDFIGSINDTALVAARIGPAVKAVANDIERTSACEVSESCLSRSNGSGRGPMSIALEGVAAQAFSIIEALEAGASERRQLLESLNRLVTRYNETLADKGLSISDRRTTLQASHSEIQQLASALLEALPINLVDGFISDLRSGASIAGNPNGSRILSAFLREHGDRLNEHLAKLPVSYSVAPRFPERPGMLDVLGYIADFAAIAAIVFVGELCLPITLYVMTWLRLVWEVEKRSPARVIAREDDGFDGLIDPPKEL